MAKCFQNKDPISKTSFKSTDLFNPKAKFPSTPKGTKCIIETSMTKIGSQAAATPPPCNTTRTVLSLLLA